MTHIWEDLTHNLVPVNPKKEVIWVLGPYCNFPKSHDVFYPRPPESALIFDLQVSIFAILLTWQLMDVVSQKNMSATTHGFNDLKISQVIFESVLSTVDSTILLAHLPLYGLIFAGLGVSPNVYWWILYNENLYLIPMFHDFGSPTLASLV